MKQVMTGRGTGKSTETVRMLARDERLWCIIPNQYRGFSKKNIYEPLCKNLPEKVRESVLSRIVTYDEFVEGFHFRGISRIPRDAKFHIEEVDNILRDFLKINFDTMTTSHWSVQKFEETNKKETYYVIEISSDIHGKENKRIYNLYSEKEVAEDVADRLNTGCFNWDENYFIVMSAKNYLKI